MSEVINSSIKKARKQHRCDYCGAIIEKGEKYYYSFCKYAGEVYEWKSHLECKYIVNELWDYLDPDDCGVSSDLFNEALLEFCQTFICPNCDKAIKQNDNSTVCSDKSIYCIDKIYEILKTHKLVRVRDKNGRLTYSFKLVLREDDSNG